MNHFLQLKVFTDSTKVDLNVPPVGVNYATTYTHHIQQPEMELGSSYNISSFSFAVSHGEKLLSIIGELLVAAVATQDTTYASQDYLAWFLDCINVFLDLQNRRETLSTTNKEEGIKMSLLMTAEVLSKTLSITKTSELSLKAHITQATLLNAVLAAPPDSQNDEQQLFMARVVLRLSAACQTDASLRQVVSCHLGSLSEMFATEVSQINRSTDLKVGVLLPKIASHTDLF